MEIVELTFTDTDDELSMEDSNGVNIRVFSMKDFHQTDWSVRIEQIGDPNILLLDVSLWYVCIGLILQHTISDL